MTVTPAFVRAPRGSRANPYPSGNLSAPGSRRIIRVRVETTSPTSIQARLLFGAVALPRRSQPAHAARSGRSVSRCRASIPNRRGCSVRPLDRAIEHCHDEKSSAGRSLALPDCEPRSPK